MLRAGQHEFNGIKLIERSRKLNHGVKRYTHMSEINRPGVLVVNEETGYYVVNEKESVIFYSFSDAARGIFLNFILISSRLILFYSENIMIELVIIRGVAQQAPFSSSLYSWLASVVKQACSDRRNVRVSI